MVYYSTVCDITFDLTGAMDIKWCGYRRSNNLKYFKTIIGLLNAAQLN